MTEVAVFSLWCGQCEPIAFFWSFNKAATTATCGPGPHSSGLLRVSRSVHTTREQEDALSVPDSPLGPASLLACTLS